MIMAMMLLPQTSEQARRWAKMSQTDQGSTSDRTASRADGMPRVAWSRRSGPSVNRAKTRPTSSDVGFMLTGLATLWVGASG